MISTLVLSAFAASASLPPPTNVLAQCSASQISVTFDGENGNFSGMSHAGTLLVVRNVGASACRMSALPELRFQDAAHQPLSIVRQVSQGMHLGPVVRPVAIAPGAEATAELRWVSGDVYGAHHCVTPALVMFRIGNETHQQAFAGQFCSAANMPATFTQTWLKTDAAL